MAIREDRQVLLHILKHNPQEGEVYITWAGETFRGVVKGFEVSANADSFFNEFTITGYLNPHK